MSSPLKARSSLKVCFEELMCKMLGKEGKKSIRTKSLWCKYTTSHQFLHNNSCIRGLLFTWNVI